MLQCLLIDTVSAGDTNQIAMCTPLALATDLLILLVSLCPQDACASVDVLTLYYCITVLNCMIASTPTVYNEY